MAEPAPYLVVDIGKTLSKVTAWTRDGRMVDREVRPNAVRVQGAARRLDVSGIGAWLRETLARFADRSVEAIVPVAHGAGVAALGGEDLLFAPLDYEQAIPDAILAEYRSLRDPFAITGSPPLPDGLNLGAQLFWMERLHPDAMARATLVTWAQYWAWFLSGQAASEVTSLGCHTDLWQPDAGTFSPLVRNQGWAERLAPMARAGDVIGTLRPELAAATGLSPQTRILAGLHDSNAALLAARGFAEIAGNEATILSTGTWFVAMRLPGAGGPPADLPADRDCLVNVDVHGRPVPSARFMGGREIESVIELDTRRVDIGPDQPALLAAVPGVLEAGAMLLPTLAPGCGPFPHAPGTWIDRPDDWHARRAAACLYAALVADVSLGLIGASERLLIEGRFAEAQVFVRALASLRPDLRVLMGSAQSDVSFGALRLIDPALRPAGELRQVEPLGQDLSGYRALWTSRLEQAA